MDSTSFLEKIKATKEFLGSDNGKLSRACMEFIKESIDFLKASNASATDKVIPADWFPVLVKCLQTLHERRGEKETNMEMILSYMNHVLIHLVNLNEVQVDWFRSLGLINLEFLLYYSLSPSHKPDYLSSLIQKSHQCMRIAAQKANGNKNANNNSGNYFQLLVMGCSFLTLETSVAEQQEQQQQPDILNSCKGYVSSFLQSFVRQGESFGFVNETAEEAAKELCRLCCMFYCLYSRTTGLGVQTEKDACFFKELFRLVHHFPPFRDKLVGCHGDFSSLVTGVGEDAALEGFSLEHTHNRMVENAKSLHGLLSENKAFQFAASVCRVLHILMQKSEDFENQLTAELEKSTNHLHSVFADYPSTGSRLPQYVGEIVSVFSLVNGGSFKALSSATGSALHDFLSLSLDVLIRDVICYSGSPSAELSGAAAVLVSHRSYDMAVVNKMRMGLLQSLLLHNDLDNGIQVGASGRLKCSLNLLCTLVKKVKKGSGLSTNSSSYRTVFKTLKNAVSYLGGLCRLLRRSEKHDVIIAVAGPLWPVANLPEMLSHVTHHESLCEAHRISGDVQSACQVVVQASALGGHLVTQALLKSVLKIAKTESALKIPVLFSRCPEEIGVAILMSLIRLMSASSSSSQALTKHQKTILRHLSSSAPSSMIMSEKVLVKLLLAELCWYYPDVEGVSVSCQDKPVNSSDEPLDLLNDCTEEDETDVRCQDFKAQAILLAAEIRHALACLKESQTSKVDKKTDNNQEKKNNKKTKLASPTRLNFSSSVTPENNQIHNSSVSSSNSNNINMPPPTALEAPTFNSSSYDTPVTHSTSKGKISSKSFGRMKGRANNSNAALIQPPSSSSSSVFPIWEDTNASVENQGKDDDDDGVEILEEDFNLLMDAAFKSLVVWKEWYEGFCGNDEELRLGSVSLPVLDKDGKVVGNSDAASSEAAAMIFRVDRSLAFLQHLVSLGLAHDKPLFALDCLHYAKELSSKTQRLIIARHVDCIRLSLLGQLGLEEQMSDSEGGPSCSASAGDILLKAEQEEPSQLVSVAAYLFYTHKVRESVCVQKAALAHIESSRDKELLTPTLTLQLSELKCLMVECSRVLAIQDIYQEEALPDQHPLQVVGEALKYITSLKSYFMGKTEHVLTVKGASVDSWQMIYHYLNTLYLGGKVFLQAGMVKSSRTYLLEGLKMAQSCQLYTWNALFTTALANISINYTDSLQEASKYLKDVSKFSSLTSPSCNDDTNLSSVDDTNLSSVDSVLTSLSSVMDDVDMDTSSSFPVDELEMNGDDSVTNPVDFSPKLLMFQVYRMWLEAEVTLQSNPPDFPKAIHLLSKAKSFAASILATRLHMRSVHNCRHSAALYELLHVETSIRLGQAFLLLLTEKSKHFDVNKDNILSSDGSSGEIWDQEQLDKVKHGLLSLLENVILKGKRLSYCYEGKVVVATAQLLKIHTSVLTVSLMNQKLLCAQDRYLVLDKKSGKNDDDEKDVWMDCDDDDSEENCNHDYEASRIAKEVKELRLEEEFWNEKQKQRMSGNCALDSDESTPSALLSSCSARGRTPCHDKTSEIVNTDPPLSASSTKPSTPSSLSPSTPTKRSSPSVEDEENVIPPTPPKMSKDDSSSGNKSSVKMRGIIASSGSTPLLSFMSPVSRTVTKGKRGRGGKSGATTSSRAASKMVAPASGASKVLHFNDGKEMEESGHVGKEVTSSLTQNEKGLKSKMGGRGRRGRGKLVDTGRGNNDCSVDDALYNENLHDGMDASSGSSSKPLELSPIMDQLGKLNICRKSVSPVKRKSGGESRAMKDEEEDEGEKEKGVAESGNEKEEKRVVSGRGRRGGRGRGKTTSVRSTGISRKKSQVVNEEENRNSLGEGGMELVESCSQNEVKGHQEDGGGSDSPKVKVKRKGKIATTASSKTSTAKSVVGTRGSRRNTRRNQEEGENDEENIPEIQRGVIVGHDDIFESQNIHLFSPSLSLESSSDIEDSFNITPSSLNFQDIESPMKRESLSSLPISDARTNLDIFSTPLRELRLNSPIEIPRGRLQRKTLSEKQQTVSVKEGKEKSELKNVENSISSAMEMSRGFGDDSDQENVENQMSTSKSRKVGKSKLSLRKNTKKETSVLCDNDEGKTGVGRNFGIENENENDNLEECLEKDEIALKSECESEKFFVAGLTKKTTGKSDGKKKAKGDGRKKRVSGGKNLQKMKTERETKAKIPATSSVRKLSALSSSHLPEASFFSAGDTVRDDEMLEEAVESLRQLSAFPPSHTFNHLSKAAAVLLMNKASAKSKDIQTSVAAHLSNSMHVTFQHMLNKNLISKLRVKKSSDKQPGSTKTTAQEDSQDTEEERVLMKEVLGHSFLQGRIEESLLKRLENIPKDWVVVQMAVVTLDLFQQHSAPCQVMITRMSSDRPPMTFRIPIDRWKDFSSAKRVLEFSIVHNVEGMTPEKYWTYRYKNDQDLKNLLYFLQEKFLSGHKWLLSGRLSKLSRNKPVTDILNREAMKLASEIEQHGDDDDGEATMDVVGLESILEILLLANEKDIQSLLLSIWPNKKDVCNLVKSAALKLQKEMWSFLHEEKKGEENKTMERGPVVLILDKQFNDIPWESMPVLKSDNISRVPSLAALDALLHLHQHRPDSTFHRGVGRRNVMTVIDPETNLENSVKLLQPQYEKYEGWKCQTQQALTVSALKEYLSQELYIYSGHGWGRQFVAGDELQMFRAKAVAIIMGCNSGRMDYGRMTDGQGPPLYFLLAGCPAVVGNLWVVTDKDIDKLTSCLCHAWMTSKGQRSLGHLLTQARSACKLVGLNGFAPVIYGLPIQMN